MAFKGSNKGRRTHRIIVGGAESSGKGNRQGYSAGGSLKIGKHNHCLHGDLYGISGNSFLVFTDPRARNEVKISQSFCCCQGLVPVH